MYCYGQLVTDSTGDVCLAHKGGLGGGKYTVAPAPFADLIEGFEREPVQDGTTELAYFIIGRLSGGPFWRDLGEFVHQAQRIRDLRSDQAAFKAALETVGGKVRNGRAVGSTDYKDETLGKGSYRPPQEVAFERIHAHVQRALAAELRKRRLKFGNRRQRYGLGPDLYVKDEHGNIRRIFEIKVGQDPQSTFTALGQLLVYSAGENPAPLATLVTRGLPRSPQFMSALKAQRITILRYSIDVHRRVKFLNLDDVLR